MSDTKIFEIYWKENCPYCDLAKALLTEKGFNYISYKIPDQVSREFVLNKFPTMRTVPIILFDGNLIGGYTELLKWVETRGEK